MRRRFAALSLTLVVLAKSENREGLGMVMREHFSLACRVLVSLTGWLWLLQLQLNFKHSVITNTNSSVV